MQTRQFGCAGVEVSAPRLRCMGFSSVTPLDCRPRKALPCRRGALQLLKGEHVNLAAIVKLTRAVIGFLVASAVAWFHAADAAAQTEVSQVVTRAGSTPSAKAPAEFFTGTARLDRLFAPNDSAAYSGAYVTFEPGARSNWHTHPAGQHLIVTSGVGYTQVWGGPIVELRAGDHVWCPPGVKHWHGASPTSSMTHIALPAIRDGKNTEWMEPVTDGQYVK